MDFFARQHQTSRRSRLLVVLFALTAISLIIGVNAALFAVWQIFGDTPNRFGFSSYQWLQWWQSPAAATIAVLTLMVIAIGGLVRARQLHGGGVAVAEGMGGREVARSTTDADERRLLNVVDEIAIAAASVPPRIYVLDQEPAINAFVAGTRPENMALAVTAGLLRALDRDELQGVIAHEFSHIVEGDVALQTRLIALLAGIQLISRIGLVLLRHDDRRLRRGGSALVMAIGLVLWLVGACGWWGARLIQAAVSRQREYLADAGAVRLTRQTRGLAGALRKILDTPAAGFLSGGRASEISHLCIAANLRSRASWFATHPPLQHRIQALQPWFRLLRPVKEASPTDEPRAGLGLAQPLPTAATLPTPVAAALHDPALAGRWLLALALSQQQAAPASAVNGTLADLLLMRAQLQDIRPSQRLPLAQLLVATARQLDPQRRTELNRALKRIVDSDGERNLFDQLLLALWCRHSEPQPVPGALFHHYDEVAPALLTLLLATAHGAEGSSFEERLKLAMSGFNLAWPEHTEAPSPSALVAALAQLRQLHPLLKGPLVQACEETLRQDGRMSPTEHELSWLIQLLLDHPAPALPHD